MRGAREAYRVFSGGNRIQCALTLSSLFFIPRCLIKWLEVRKVCPLCNMPVLQLAQLHNKQDHGPPQGPLPGAENIV